MKVSRHETKEHGHGRDEHRTYYVCDVPDDLPDRARWKGLKRIGVAISDTVRGGKPVDDVRYYILSKKLSATGPSGPRCEAIGGSRIAALATRRDVRRGPLPDPERARRRQLQHPPPHGA